MTLRPVASGTFAWNPALSDLIISAYARCQIRRTALTVDHLQDAAMAANLLQVEWSNEQVNLWTVEFATIPLVEGQASYDLDPSTVMIMAAYISSGEYATTIDSTNIRIDTDVITIDTVSTPAWRDRILTSVDRDTYASFPDKLHPPHGSPSVYWFQSKINPVISLWQPPDASQRYMLHFYYARQMFDANMANGTLPDVPYPFMEAYVAGLAFKLAEMYAPARMEQLAVKAKMTFDAAAQRDVEDSPLRIVPALSTYTSSVY